MTYAHIQGKCPVCHQDMVDTVNAAFKAGAASRDAEVDDLGDSLAQVKLKNEMLILERDQLRAQIASLRGALSNIHQKARTRDAYWVEATIEEVLFSHPEQQPPPEGVDVLERDKLRAELVYALAACKVKDEALKRWKFDSLNMPLSEFEVIKEALALQPDDSALKAWLGEPVAEVDDSGVVIVCRYDYKPKDKFYSPKELK